MAIGKNEKISRQLDTVQKFIRYVYSLMEGDSYTGHSPVTESQTRYQILSLKEEHWTPGVRGQEVHSRQWSNHV